MAYLTVGLVLVGLLCVLDLVLTFGVIRRLREPQADAARAARDVPPSILAAGGAVGPFSAVDTAGRNLSRDSLSEGLLITFMSPGCPACEELLPLVVERAREYGPERVLAVVVLDKDKKADTGEYTERLSPVARVVVGVLGDELTQAFEITGVPAYVEMGVDGRIASSGRTLPHRTHAVKVGT